MFLFDMEAIRAKRKALVQQNSRKNNSRQKPKLSNFEALKSEFKEYLEAKGITGSDTSIFGNLAEFTKFYESKYGSDSAFITSKSASELKSQNFLTNINNELQNLQDSEAQIADSEDALAEEGRGDSIEDSDAEGKGDKDLINEVFAELLESDEFKNTLDKDSNGKISMEELKGFINNICGYDGVEKDITIEDLLMAAEKISDGSYAAEEAKKAEAAKSAARTAQHAAANAMQQSSNPAIASAGRMLEEKTLAETKAEIEQAISDKNTQMETIKAQADSDIADIEAKKDEAMKQAGLKEEEIAEYKKREQQYETDIAAKETAISAKDDEIRGYQNSITSNENYIAMLQIQLDANTSATAAESGPTQNKANILQYNANLQAEIDRLTTENSNLEIQKQKALAEKEALEEEKEALEEEKEALLATMFEEGFGSGLESAVKDELQAQITQYDEEIKTVRETRDTQISKLKDDIDKLQVQLKDVEATTERKDFLKENKGDGIDKEIGERLAEYAKANGGSRGSHGWCLAGVNSTLAAAFGFGIYEGSAYMTVDNWDSMVQQGYFQDITGDFKDYNDLAANCPAGAIIVWERSSSSPHGHITVSLGPGQGEASDHVSDYIYNIGTRFHVYYPDNISFK